MSWISDGTGFILFSLFPFFCVRGKSLLFCWTRHNDHFSFFNLPLFSTIFMVYIRRAYVWCENENEHPKKIRTLQQCWRRSDYNLGWYANVYYTRPKTESNDFSPNFLIISSSFRYIFPNLLTSKWVVKGPLGDFVWTFYTILGENRRMGISG